MKTSEEIAREIDPQCGGFHRGQLVRAAKMGMEQATPAWQPMSTAPKSGEVILRVKERAGIPNCTLVGHWLPGGHCIEGHPPVDEGWYFWNGCMFDKAAEPTQWMKLPS